MDSRIYKMLVENRDLVEEAYRIEMQCTISPAISKKEYFTVIYNVLDELSAREITMICNNPTRIKQKIQKGCKLANQKLHAGDRRELLKLCYEERNAMGMYAKRYC